MKTSTAVLLVAVLSGVACRIAAQDLACTDSAAGSYQSQSGHILPDNNVVDGVPGGDPTYGGTSQSDATACWEFCATVDGCVAVTFNLQGKVNCFLKNTNPSADNSEANPGAVTLSACGDAGRIAAPPATASPPATSTTPPTDATAMPPTATAMTPPTTSTPTTTVDVPTAVVPLDTCTTAETGMDYDGSDVAELPTDTAEACAVVCAYVLQCSAVSYLVSGKCYLKGAAALAAGSTAKSTTAASYDMTGCKDESTYTVLDITDPSTQAALVASYPGFTVLDDSVVTDSSPTSPTTSGAMTPPTVLGMSPPSAGMTTPPTTSTPPPAPVMSGTPVASSPPPSTTTNGSQSMKAACAVLAVTLFSYLLL